MSYIDMDAVDRQAWDKQVAEFVVASVFFLLNLLKLLRLGEPDDGESLKQVGKDPAREYQELEEETCSYLICPSLC